jgi:hypothetical protein
MLVDGGITKFKLPLKKKNYCASQDTSSKPGNLFNQQPYMKHA